METDKDCKNLLVSPSSSQCMEHYGCIYENNHLVTLLVDPASGNIADANRAACAFYGFTLQEIRKLHTSDLNRERAAGPGSFVKKALPSGEYQGNQVFAEKHRLAGGKVHDVEIHTGLVTMLGKTCIYSVVHDITERVKSEQRLKESEERYRDLVERCPEAILVYSGGLILFANRQAERLFGKPRAELIGKSVRTFFNNEYISSAEYGKLKAREHALGSFRFEHRFIRYDGNVFDLELSGAPIVYEEAAAVQLVLRDITESKRELERAARLQEQRHAASFPLESRAVLEKLYVPAKTLSGDFFVFHKIDDEQVIGIIGDVTGKGITAALNISALRVLFSESLLVARDPVRLLEDMNRKAMKHLGEDYIAVCCFHLDFCEGRLKAAGAGINEFMYVPGGGEGERITIKGAPLGMFGDSEFEEATLAFKPGDKFCFYSDGMDLLFDGAELCGGYEHLSEKVANTVLRDDCTWLSLKIR